MTTNQPLSLFISSKMAELSKERRAVQDALSAYQMHGWLFEKDAGARPEPIQSTYLKEVEACDIYIGLFWLGYGPYTIEEYEKARSLDKPCLIYEKYMETDKRDPQLKTFLQGIQQVTDSKGLTVFRFETIEVLREQVQKDVMHLLVTQFRQSRQQPQPPPPVSLEGRVSEREREITETLPPFDLQEEAHLIQPRLANGLQAHKIDGYNVVSGVQINILKERDYRGITFDHVHSNRTQPSNYIPFPRNALFQPRPGEFERLESLLFEPGKMQRSVRIGLVGMTGMGGIGKTQLAVGFAYRCLDQNRLILTLSEPACLNS